jgi:hypothetical protein
LVHGPLIGLRYQSRIIDESGEFSGIGIDTGNRISQRISSPVPLCPPQIPRDLTRDRTQAASMGSRRLTATRPFIFLTPCRQIPGWAIIPSFQILSSSSSISQPTNRRRSSHLHRRKINPKIVLYKPDYKVTPLQFFDEKIKRNGFFDS